MSSYAIGHNLLFGNSEIIFRKFAKDSNVPLREPRKACGKCSEILESFANLRVPASLARLPQGNVEILRKLTENNLTVSEQ